MLFVLSQIIIYEGFGTSSLDGCIVVLSGVPVVIIYIFIKGIFKYRFQPFQRFKNGFEENTRIIVLVVYWVEYNIWLRGVKRGKSSSASVFTEAGSSPSG